MVLGKKALVIGALVTASFLLVLLLILPVSHKSPVEPAGSWNQNAIRATYVAGQLRQIDKSLAALFLSYDLQNNTDHDYRLADAANIVIMSRLQSGHSLSQEEPIRLSYPAFLPANQRVRIAIEISYPLVWPAPEDRALENKLKDFVKQRLAKVEGFVLFDEVNHYQVELPSAWQELQRD
jgi:hypothetical protein